MEKRETKTQFSYEIKACPEAHKLSVALGMVGINNNIKGCELIVRAQKAIKKMGSSFDMKTAIDIKLDVDAQFERIYERYNKQE